MSVPPHPPSGGAPGAHAPDGVWGAPPTPSWTPPWQPAGGPSPAGGGTGSGSLEQFPPAAPGVLGDDDVLYAHASDCFDGDLQACDTLYFESPPMSDYEEYALTCGGRVKAWTVVSCTELD